MRIMVIGNPGSGIGANLVDELIEIGHYASFGISSGCKVLWEKADLIIVVTCSCCYGNIFEPLEVLSNEEKLTKDKIAIYLSDKNVSLSYCRAQATVHGKIHMISGLTDEDIFGSWNNKEELREIIDRLLMKKVR
ncbi:MAG: hypothetical protein RIT04_405 [Candidatus Parcubacteria bacterium]|jgi:excinuclease UvrABC helicase subunit UvrB